MLKHCCLRPVTLRFGAAPIRDVSAALYTTYQRQNKQNDIPQQGAARNATGLKLKLAERSAAAVFRPV